MADELNIIIRDIVKDTLKKSAPGISETMRQAIANSLTMKLAAAIMVPKSRPFYGAECPSYPHCTGGCGLGCTKKIELAKLARLGPRCTCPCSCDETPRDGKMCAIHGCHLYGAGTCDLTPTDQRCKDCPCDSGPDRTSAEAADARS